MATQKLGLWLTATGLALVLGQQCAGDSAGTTGKPSIWYFATRGRAEPFRLSLALKGVEWIERGAPDDLKTNTAAYP